MSRTILLGAAALIANEEEDENCEYCQADEENVKGENFEGSWHTVTAGAGDGACARGRIGG